MTAIFFALKKHSFSTCLGILFCLFSFSAFAAEQIPLPPQVSLTNGSTKGIPIVVTLQGTDTIGANLAFQLREKLNTSSQFQMTDKDIPKILISLTTVAEFDSRPSAGSVYSVVWLYSEKPTAYSNFLAQEVGTLTMDEVPAFVMLILEKTNGIAVKHKHLLQ